MALHRLQIKQSGFNSNGQIFVLCSCESLFICQTFLSPEAVLLLVSTKNHDLWPENGMSLDLARGHDSWC